MIKICILQLIKLRVWFVQLDSGMKNFVTFINVMKTEGTNVADRVIRKATYYRISSKNIWDYIFNSEFWSYFAGFFKLL